MKTEKTLTKRAADKLVAALEHCSEELQTDFWAVTRDTLKCFVDPSFSAVHISVNNGDVRVVPINMEVEEVQDLVMWLGTEIQEERRTDIAAAAVALKN